MPYIDLKIARSLDLEGKNELQRRIGDLMSLIPGKSAGNTMICISDGCALYMGGEKIEGAFADIRFYKPSTPEAKKTFIEQFNLLLKSDLDIEPDLIYMNIVELPGWGAKGGYNDKLPAPAG
ncbi:MAG: hypothetical protein FWG32_01145 [Oscillospiraceae bacterium]|nr:hypothetical protein [Oscillospiraceae bacterium]